MANSSDTMNRGHGAFKHSCCDSAIPEVAITGTTVIPDLPFVPRP